MAADRTVGTGKTFSTPALAVADIGNLTGTGTNNIVMYSGTYNVGRFQISKTGGSTTDKIVFKVASGLEPNGIFDAPVIWTSGEIDISTYVEFYDFQINSINQGQNYSAIFVYAANPTIGVINNMQRMLVKCSQSELRTNYMIESQSATPKNYVSECVFWVTSNSPNITCIFGNSRTVVTNCVMFGNKMNGITSCVSNNNAIFNTVSGTCFASITGSNNASSDDTGSYINLTAQQFGFVDPSTGNLHVNRNSFLLGRGNDQSSLFTTDIDGDLIREWMIGFDYVSPSCWSYKAKYKNSDRIFSIGGPDKYPSCLKVPPNVDISTGRMTDEDLLIESSKYKIEQ